MKRELTLLVDGEQVVVTVERNSDVIVVEGSGERHEVRVIGDRPIAPGSSSPAEGNRDADGTPVSRSPSAQPAATNAPPARIKPSVVSAPSSPASDSSTDTTGVAVRSPMVGVIREIHVAPGDTVAAGERVITMEAMKMDIYVNAPESGDITGVSCAAGESVAEGTVLATIARSDG